MKKYCKNCRWNGTLVYDKNWIWCEYPEYVMPNRCNKYTGGKGRKRKKAIFKIEKNISGECSHYKRKWYKFWIK